MIAALSLVSLSRRALSPKRFHVIETTFGTFVIVDDELVVVVVVRTDRTDLAGLVTTLNNLAADRTLIRSYFFTLLAIYTSLVIDLFIPLYSREIPPHFAQIERKKSRTDEQKKRR